MSASSSTSFNYDTDPRTPCKYGSKCYQKNPEHHNKYKHPPKKTPKKDIRDHFQVKKRKLNDDTQEKPIIENTKNIDCISDSMSSSSEADDYKISECESGDDMKDAEADNAEKESTEVQRETSRSPQIHTELNHNEYIKEHFLVEMPGDFYEFWKFCKQINEKNPLAALQGVGLTLVGPFEVLAGKFKGVHKSSADYLIHWRYYYDPPEFQTVIKGDDKTGFHIGYFRDSPSELPVFLASNNGMKDGAFTKMGDNIFAAINIHLDEMAKAGNPFVKMQIKKLMVPLKSAAEKLDLKLTAYTGPMRKREFKVVTKTLNKLGLVVPFDKKTELGYRDLVMSDKDVMTLLTKLQNAVPEAKSKYLSELQPVINYANIAIDECDFGTGIKLGWDILYHGVDSLDSTILMFFTTAYKFLNREEFAKIAEVHLKNRKKSCNLSIL